MSNERSASFRVASNGWRARAFWALAGAERAVRWAARHASEPDVEARRAVIQALFVQGNVDALVDIARKEKDPQLRKDAVAQLSHMNSKAATDFMLEILNK